MRQRARTSTISNLTACSYYSLPCVPVQALALGADAVLVGRPILHGLAVDGQAGVEKVLNTLKAELKLNMALSGRDPPAVAAAGMQIDNLLQRPITAA